MNIYFHEGDNPKSHRRKP